MSRFEVYATGHKPLRNMLSVVMVRLGAADFTVPKERTAALRSLRAAVKALRDHAAWENEYFHPALRERVPATVDRIEAAHRELDAALAHLDLLIDHYDASGDEQSAALYLEFSRFVGRYLLHLDEEEQEFTQEYWNHFSDDELAAIYRRWEAATTGDKMLGVMPFVLTGLSRREFLTAMDPPAVVRPVISAVFGPTRSLRRRRLASLLARATGQRV